MIIKYFVMKKSEIQQIIKEEISSLTENIDPNSEEWKEGYNSYLPGKPDGAQPKNPYREPETYAEKLASTMPYAERYKKMINWTMGFSTAKKEDPNPFNIKPTDMSDLAANYYKEKGSAVPGTHKFNPAGYTGD